MHIVHPHKSCGMESESEDLEYDRPPGDIDLPDQIPSRPGAVTQSQTRAQQLVQAHRKHGPRPSCMHKQVNNYVHK